MMDTLTLLDRLIAFETVSKDPNRPLIDFVLSLLTEYVSWLGTSLQLPVAFAVLVAVLVIRPAGLFGRLVVRRV